MRRPRLCPLTHQLGDTAQMDYPVWAHFLLCGVKMTIPASLPLAVCEKSYAGSLAFLHGENRGSQTEGPRGPRVSTEAVSSPRRSSERLPSQACWGLAPPTSRLQPSWAMGIHTCPAGRAPH